MSSLPIDKIKAQFLNALETENLVVEAETGSGKSTRLPLWAAEQGRVLVIEPRRIACTSLAGYLAQESRTPTGEKIGYAIKLESRFNDKTQVVFVTPGIALRWFATNKLQDFDTILIDEFHERRWDTDLLLAMLLKNNDHRLVVTSATIEGQKLADYITAQRLIAEGRRYHVAIKHHCRDSHYLPDAKNLLSNVVAAVKQYYSDTPGDVLIFMPGRKEIAQVAQSLCHLPDTEVVQLHATVSDRERDVALRPFDAKKSNIKKIVVATNVAETSLTIPGVTLVIDSGLERRTLQRNGRTVLSLKNISRAAAAQRAGRAGRVTDGMCIRLYGEHAPLEAVTPPELLREDLSEAMLASACCGYRFSELRFLNPLPEKSLRQARATLVRLNAIDAKEAVTEHGKVLYPLPVDTLYADMITRMPSKQTKEAMTDLAAALSVPAALYRLPDNEEALERLANWEPYHCDAELLIKLVRGKKAQGVRVDPDAVKEARGLAKQIRAAFSLPELEVASGYCREALLRAIIELHPELLFVRREKRREALGNGVIEMMPGRNSRFSEKEEAAIILDQHSLPGKGVKQTLNLATVMMPVPLSLLVQAGFGEWCQGETEITEGKLYTRLNLVYAGRVIASKQVAAEGELALKPLLDAVLSDEVLAGFAAKRKQEIAHWRLFVELGLDENCHDHHNIDFESWFVSQLSDLGVADIDELALFGEEDIPFKGIPYWQYDDFSESYPFELSLGELNLTVEYHSRKKLIYVIYHSGLRKSEPKRWELPKWPGWRVQYKKASRIIDIR